MNEPIGRFGSCRPARARRTAVDTAVTASSWPTTRFSSCVFHAQQLLALAFEHAVDRNAGPARHHRRHVVGGHRLRGDDNAAGFRFGRFQLALKLGNDAVLQFAGALIVAAPWASFGEIVLGLVELFLQLGRRVELVLLGLPLRGERVALSSRSARSFSRRLSRSFDAASRSFFSACCSILSRTISRSRLSSSSGLESICMRSRAAASSTRSIALSGRKRSVM